jgi:simple sugar transport system ATP-binding protein
MNEPHPQKGQVTLVNVTKRFPGVVAVDNVSLTFNVGEVHVLLGENGAGKSTVVGMLSGLQEPDEGHIEIDGRKMRLSSPTESLAIGINTVFQHAMLVPTLTVFENLVLGTPWWESPRRSEVEARVEELSREFNLSIPLDARAGDLSLGEQQQIEIARALLRDSHMLILDEATSMLTPQGAEELGERMRRLAERGIGVIFITHKLNEAYRYGDRISVLKLGQMVGEISPERLSSMSEEEAIEEKVKLMFGREQAKHKPVRTTGSKPGEVRLVAKNLTTHDAEGTVAIENVSFELRAGEILGIAGIDGNGQKQLAEALAGQRPLASGHVLLDGDDISDASIGSRRKLGLRYLTDDRLSEGTVGAFPILYNTVLKEIGTTQFWNKGFERTRRISEHAQDMIEKFEVKTPSETTPIGHLSGGNIQKILLGRELHGDPRIVIFNKPTYGLDLQNINASRIRIREIADSGIAALVISTDLDEILEISDRIMVMESGVVQGLVKNDRTDPGEFRKKIGRMMVGEGIGA